jgi:hypothetical protein
MREVRLLVECAWEVGTAANEGAAESQLESKGWTVHPIQKCPKCRKFKPVEKGDQK